MHVFGLWEEAGIQKGPTQAGYRTQNLQSVRQQCSSLSHCAALSLNNKQTNKQKNTFSLFLNLNRSSPGFFKGATGLIYFYLFLRYFLFSSLICRSDTSEFQAIAMKKRLFRGQTLSFSKHRALSMQFGPKHCFIDSKFILNHPD